MSGFDYTLAALNKKMWIEGERERIAEQKRKFGEIPIRVEGATRKERVERPATAARREREYLYGKWNPANGVSECCFMIRAANGTCTGCGE